MFGLKLPWFRNYNKGNAVPASRIIAELNADELARHAFNVFMLCGRHVTGAKLIYHALTLNPYQPEAIRCLSDFLYNDGNQENDGTRQLSLMCLEYALAPDSPITATDRKTLDDLLFFSKWCSGFSRHKSGSKYLSGEAFNDRSQFILDEAQYTKFQSEILSLAGIGSGAFKAAHTLCGAMGGLLAHVKFGPNAPFPEIFHSENFHRTSAYDFWLKTNTLELDALEARRNELAKK